MPAKPDDLFTFLDQLHVSYRTVTHPPLFTVEQSRSLRGQIPGGHTKNLFLKDKKGALFLVVALEDAAIELKSLQQRVGSARLSFGSADLLRKTLGVEPGAVTPFAAINDTSGQVKIILDAAMMEHETLNYPRQQYDHLDRTRRPAQVPRSDRPLRACCPRFGRVTACDKWAKVRLQSPPPLPFNPGK